MLSGTVLTTAADCFEDGETLADAKEALLFSLLGMLALQGRAGNVPSCTGATKPTVCTTLVLPLYYPSTTLVLP